MVVEFAGQKSILIEVKYRESAPVPETDAICRLCKEAAAAIIVTKNANDFGVRHTASGDALLSIPAFAFLYLLGHIKKNGSEVF